MKSTQQKAPSIGRFIDPLSDFGFKRIFGSEPNKDLLISFLNALFKGRKVIKDLVYNTQEKSGPAKHYRKAIFDLTCTGRDGEIFIIEMQKAEQKFFIDRAVFYTSSILYEQGQKGEKDWNYELLDVYLIGLMDFNFDNTQPGKYLHRVWLTEEETNEVFYEKLGYIFLELPNFNIGENEIKTDLEGWMYVLRNMGKMDKIPVFLHKKIFQRLFKIAEIANLNKEEYMLYERSLMEKWDTYAIKQTAEEKLKKALKEGMEKGMEKGIEKGMEKGMERGVEKSKELFVKNLINKFDFTDEQAANAAEVSVGFVKKIRVSLKKKK